MNATWSWVAITCLLILGSVFMAAFILAAIDAADTIRAYRNDRADARDVKRGVL